MTYNSPNSYERRTNLKDFLLACINQLKTIILIIEVIKLKDKLGFLALGTGIGAGVMFAALEYKNGNLSNMMDKGAKGLKDISKKIK